MRIIYQLRDDRWHEIRDYVNTRIKPLATAEQARCAFGRLNLWLNAEPDYALTKYRPAHRDDRLWRYLQRVTSPEMALAQVYFADNNRGIDWHRDAAYSAPSAYILNLGAVRLETRDEDDRLISLSLTGGEIVRFNSKSLHRAIPLDESRVGIGVWRDAISLKDPGNWL